MNKETCPTGNLERLLLASDDCEYCEGAVRESIRLAKACNSKLYAISVVEVNQEFEALAPQLVEKSEKDNLAYLKKVRERAGAEGVDCETITREGEDTYKYIVEEAAKQNADMVIMGRRGRTGLKRLLMGSVTARVIGHSPCSVLVVPKDAKVEFKGIVMATDGSKYSEAAAAVAASIAKRRGASLTVVSAAPSETMSPLDIASSQMPKDMAARKELGVAEQNVKAARAIAEKEGIKTEGYILGGHPYEAIMDIARQKKADLIVMGSHGRTGLERLFMGSVTERVVGLSSSAVLVVKTK
jgi:nucleotide-binding universal stress UspA family protein